MRFLLHNDVLIAARFSGDFHGTRRLRRRGVLVNLDSVALKRRQKIVNLFGGMHLGWERIVYFVVQQVAALFAYRNELAYCIVFFFKTCYRHELPPEATKSFRSM